MRNSFTNEILRTNMAIGLLVAAMLSLSLTVFSYIDYRQLAIQADERYIEVQKTSLKNKVNWFKQYINSQKDKAEQRLRETLHYHVEEACRILQSTIAVAPAEQTLHSKLLLAREALRPIRFLEGRGYYFMFDLEGTEILFAAQPEMEGKNMLGISDGEGRFVVREMIELAKSRGEGYYEYLWSVSV